MFAYISKIYRSTRHLIPSFNEFFWVLVPLKMGNMAFCLFLRPQEICQMLQGGYACTKIFYSWNSVTLDFGGHICQIMHFEDTYGALERNIPEKKRFIFQSQLRPKVTIKGRKKIEIKGAEIRKKVVISLCLFRYGTFFEYKTIA